MMDGLYVKNANGQYVNISKGTPVPITAEDRLITKQRSVEYQQKLANEKLKKRVPPNEYHIQTIRKIYKDLGYDLKLIYGGYKGGRYQPRQKYDIIETFGDKRVVAENLNYYELGQILESIGALNNDTHTE